MKLLSVLSIVFFLTACASPPKPTPFPGDVRETNVVSQNFLNYQTGDVPKNRFEKNNGWQYSLTTWGSALNHTYHAQLWYLAHHANRIVIVGSNDNIQAINNQFMREGTTKDITLTPMCYTSKRQKCPDLVNLYFYKDAPVIEVAEVKKFVETETRINP